MTRFRPFVVGAVLGVVALALVPLAGLPTHRAGEGPGLTGWYGWIAARQSVTLRSLTVTPPPLDDPAMARRAAGHYEMVCAACHGSPAAPAQAFARDLTPAPPFLAEADRWRPEARLFQTIRHGIRRSAMPAWPSDLREDEMWDMVAFLRVLPDLSVAEYRALAGDGDCTGCHGEDGAGRDGIPRLDILSPDYLAATLRAFRDGSRASGTMIAAARGLSEADIAALAERFGTGAAAPIPEDDGPAARIARFGLPERDIPACLSCHGAGDPAIYPRLSGQAESYLRRQLMLFAEHGTARGGPHAAIMAEVARGLEQEEIDALAEWFAGGG